MITITDIKSVIGAAVKYPAISRVGVFGSYARGEQTDNSDIDILYDYEKHDDDYIFDVLNYGDELISAFDIMGIEIDFVSFKGLTGSSMRNDIIDDVVWLYEQ